MFYYMVRLILQKVKHSIAMYRLTPERLAQYAAAFHRRGVPEILRLYGPLLMLKSSRRVVLSNINEQCTVVTKEFIALNIKLLKVLMG
jgi:hypothetical protein